MANITTRDSDVQFEKDQEVAAGALADVLQCLSNGNYSTRQQLVDALKERIVVIEGAMKMDDFFKGL